MENKEQPRTNEAYDKAEEDVYKDRALQMWKNHSDFLTQNDALFDNKFPCVGGGAIALFLYMNTHINADSKLSFTALLLMASAVLVHLAMPLCMRIIAKKYSDKLAAYIQGDDPNRPDIDEIYRKQYRLNNILTIAAYILLFVGVAIALVVFYNK